MLSSEYGFAPNVFWLFTDVMRAYLLGNGTTSIGIDWSYPVIPNVESIKSICAFLSSLMPITNRSISELPCPSASPFHPCTCRTRETGKGLRVNYPARSHRTLWLLRSLQ